MISLYTTDYILSRYTTMLKGHIVATVADIRAGKRPLVTLEEYKSWLMNSYDRALLLPFLSNEALLHCIEHALRNSTPSSFPPATYDDALMHAYLPVLIERFLKPQIEAEKMVR